MEGIGKWANVLLCPCAPFILEAPRSQHPQSWLRAWSAPLSCLAGPHLRLFPQPLPGADFPLPSLAGR